MTATDRRTHSSASQIVKNALEMAQWDGIGLAIDYMVDSGIPTCVAYRVMTDPAYQRHQSDRRAVARCTLKCDT